MSELMNEDQGHEQGLSQDRADLLSVEAEARNLRDTYGPLKSPAEAAFHVGRAYRTLERNLDDKHVSNRVKREKMLHLAAVCLRAAQSIPAFDDQLTDK